ncbi:hypothetical protein ACQCVO_12665 [Bacillus infantis]|uniref:hypothetical protein n=1 Tax=Bacillus infantis TaxID=324767 RepID=UPI003CED944D
MIKMTSFLLLSVISLYGTASGGAVAHPHDAPPPLEESYTEIGYKTVEEAVREFEIYCKKDLKLPYRLPPVPFTHQFGRFHSDREYGINDSLEIKYIHEKTGINHFRITVRPVKTKFDFGNKGTQTIYALKDGKKAAYIAHGYHRMLVFEKDGWQYVLGIDRRIEDKVTPEMLVSIADSIGFKP